MVIALFVESEMQLSEEILEQIIDKVRFTKQSMPSPHNASLNMCDVHVHYIIFFNRHLQMLMLIKMAESVKKSGRLSSYGIPPHS